MKRENRKAMTAKRTVDMHAELRRLNEERAEVLSERDTAVKEHKLLERENDILTTKVLALNKM